MAKIISSYPLDMPKCLLPKHSKWYDDMMEAKIQYYDTHFGLSDAMRGCSKRFSSASQHTINHELQMRRYLHELWKSKLMWAETEAKKAQMWERLIIDDGLPTEEKFYYNPLTKTWCESPKKKENKMKKWKFFKAIRMQTQKLETVVSALKWFGLIKWDEWDEKYYTIKPNGIPEQDVSMRLCNIAKFVHNAKLKLDDLPIRENQLEERMTEVELKEKAVDENTENIKSLVDYFFVDDYFDGKDSAPYSGVKFGNKILKETAETFEMIDSNPMRLGNLLNLSNFNESTWKYIKTCYTSGDNALEHKATIARYEKEVANYRKTLKRRSK